MRPTSCCSADQRLAARALILFVRRGVARGERASAPRRTARRRRDRRRPGAEVAATRGGSRRTAGAPPADPRAPRRAPLRRPARAAARAGARRPSTRRGASGRRARRVRSAASARRATRDRRARACLPIRRSRPRAARAPSPWLLRCARTVRCAGAPPLPRFARRPLGLGASASSRAAPLAVRFRGAAGGLGRVRLDDRGDRCGCRRAPRASRAPALGGDALVHLAHDRARALRRALVLRARGNLLELAAVGDPLDRGERRILELAVERDAEDLGVILQPVERGAPHASRARRAARSIRARGRR